MIRSVCAAAFGLVIALEAWSSVAAQESAPCNCNGNTAVAINELITGVNILLGIADVSTCTAADADGDQIVEVNELIRCVQCANGAPDPPTAEQRCDRDRVHAWADYQHCVDGIVAELYGSASECFDSFKQFWKCRRTYFDKWTAFQADSGLQGSSCINSRFTDNGDGTVTDNLSGLMWEQKTDDFGIHGSEIRHTWSTRSSSTADGSAFTTFLAALNTGAFGGASDWRLPTVAELQTIEPDFDCVGSGLSSTCICPVTPCIEPILGLSQSDGYWCSMECAPRQADCAWAVGFDYGGAETAPRAEGHYVRAVRGGL